MPSDTDGNDPPRAQRQPRRVVVLVLGVLAAIVLLWDNLVNWTDIGIMVAMYLLTAGGVTTGHCMLTQSGVPWYPDRADLGILGSLSVQGSVLDWVADHRKHHAHTDIEGDPHSPHVGHGHGLSGFWHAHAGWLMETQGQPTGRNTRATCTRTRRCRDRRPVPYWALLSLPIPTLAGRAARLHLEGARGPAGLGRLAASSVHHATWTRNSICHIFAGAFDIEDKSTNVWWLAPFSLGESWHHNHHASRVPAGACRSPLWWELDISAAVIRVMKKLGLAWNVIRIAPDRQEAKLLEHLIVVPVY